MSDNDFTSKSKKLFGSYTIRSKKVAPEYFRTSDSIEQELYFDLPALGLLNKLLLRLDVTFNSLTAGTDNNNVEWPSLSLLEYAELYCNKDLLQRITNTQLLSTYNNASLSDKSIIVECSPYNLNLTDGAAESDSLYVLLKFPILDSIFTLIDTEYVGKLKLKIKLRKLNEVFTNAETYSLDNINCITQYIVLDDYKAYYNKKYKKQEKLIIKDFEGENRFLFNATSGTLYQSPLIKLDSKKNVNKTCFYLHQINNTNIMTASDFATFKLYNGSELVYETDDFSENLFLNHMEKRFNASIKDNTASDSYIYCLNHDVHDYHGMSNTLDLSKKNNYHFKFTFLPNFTGPYELNIDHEYFKKIMYNNKGQVEMEEV